MQITERQFNVRGMQLAAKCWHDPSLPPLLALHGWLDNAGSFDRLAPWQANYHVIALDFAGHGQSAHRPAHTRYHTLDHVDDVHAVVTQAGWKKFTLVGHSMGAGIASLFAGCFPEMIEKLVLIEGLGPLSGPPEEAPAILRRAVEQWQGYSEEGMRVYSSREEAIRARQTGIMPLGPEAAAILCERGLREVAGGLTWTTDKRLRLHGNIRIDESQVRAFLGAITAPTLLILGENGLVLDAKRLLERIEGMPTLRLERLPGGHHLHVDEGHERVGEVVRGFLS